MSPFFVFSDTRILLAPPKVSAYSWNVSMYSCFSGIILEKPADTCSRVADQPSTMVMAMNSHSSGLR